LIKFKGYSDHKGSARRLQNGNTLMLCTDCVLDSNIQGNNKRILPGPPGK